MERLDGTLTGGSVSLDGCFIKLPFIAKTVTSSNQVHILAWLVEMTGYSEVIFLTIPTDGRTEVG
jgi:hypothetical protein